jgi:hypothetical protein
LFLSIVVGLLAVPLRILAEVVLRMLTLVES